MKEEKGGETQHLFVFLSSSDLAGIVYWNSPNVETVLI